LFSGIGGFDLAAEWMGWDNVFHCEINPFGQKILKYYWPDAITYSDITKTDFSIHRGKIDVLTGGFPCQPYSLAGKRKGTEDERHLWPEMLRAIREIAPSWIVGENVFGIVNWDGGVVFEQIQADLEAEGYEVQPYVLPACGVNAPHRRDRVWFVAHSSSFDSNLSIQQRRQNQAENTNSDRQVKSGIIPDTDIHGLQGEQFNGTPDKGINEPEPQRSTGKFRKDAADTKKQRFQEWYGKPARNESHPAIERHNRIPSWQNFPTQSPLRSRNDGLSSRLDGITVSKHRNESIKAYGNAIVPQLAFQIFKSIQGYENQSYSHSMGQ